jgi:hypothetical protein
MECRRCPFISRCIFGFENGLIKDEECPLSQAIGEEFEKQQYIMNQRKKQQISVVNQVTEEKK